VLEVSKNFFTLWFFNGVFLEDEKKHLVIANEGVTKSMRQQRFTSKDEINEATILAYIKEAIETHLKNDFSSYKIKKWVPDNQSLNTFSEENEKQGKIIKPEPKNATLTIHDIVQKELNSDNQLEEAFQKISPYKQR
jgi:uncharacterized protein YdeI (YjbR/CyaY-like superfamily)